MQTEFSKLTDDQWFDKVIGKNGPALFGLPEDRIQISTTGRAGEPVLRDGFRFYQFARRMLQEHGNGLNDDTAVMDFGCAWGRILRFWPRDIKAKNLFGFEVQERLLNYARQHVPAATYRVSQTRPPLPNSGQKFDLIYAFSVFSHLPEALTNEWIEEFSKVLKPGGIACLTTRPRAHIEIAGTAASKGAHSSFYAGLIKDKNEALASYDKGNFIFYPADGGGSLSEADYGEAIIPLTYAEANWSQHLEVLGFFERYSETYLQPCFVLRKPR